MWKLRLFSVFKKKSKHSAKPMNPDAKKLDDKWPNRASSQRAMVTVFPPLNAPTAGFKRRIEAPARADNSEPKVVQLSRLSPEQCAAFFPSERIKPIAGTATPQCSSAPVQPANSLPKPAGGVTSLASERRAKRRAMISAPVRVRSLELMTNFLDDVTTTTNVSRLGVLLISKSQVYFRGMDVMVTCPLSKAPNANQPEQYGRVVRVRDLPDGRKSVAIALGAPHREEEFTLASGEKIHAAARPLPEPARAVLQREPKERRRLVLALDADASTRESLKEFLSTEGYDVIAVANSREAREVLSRQTPSVLIAEVEGEDEPGYAVSAHCKSIARLRGVPILLTTSSAFPRDYAKAHSRGAVVCLAKPYRLERLGHVVKLLAPPAAAEEKESSPPAIEILRRHSSNGEVAKMTPRRTPFSGNRK